MVKNLPANAGDARDSGLVSGLERSPGRGNGNLIFLPGKFHGQRKLIGYSPRGCKESDMTERLLFYFLSRIKSCAAAAADLQHPPKEFRVESRNEVLCALGKLAGQVLR